MIKTKHVFQLSRIIDKMKLTENLKDIAINKKSDVEAVGYKIIMSLISKIYLAEKETISLLSEVSGKTIKEVEDQSPKDTFDMIEEILKQEGVMDFLKKQLKD